MGCKIAENKNYKLLRSKSFNYNYDKVSGFTMTWGETKEDDPVVCLYGPTLADIEISTVCSAGCKFCYKNNTSKGKNMSIDTFKTVFDKLPRTLAQIAFGIGDIDGNPDLFEILSYTRSKGVIPNITINGFNMTEDHYVKLASVCGAVAVSHYEDEACFNAVDKLSSLIGRSGITLYHVNIHKLLSKDTLSSCLNLIDKVDSEPRLKGLNATVFLALKKKGRGEGLEVVNSSEYKEFVDKLFEKKITFGLDSCGAKGLSDYIVNNNKDRSLLNMIQSCESTLESIYINTDGVAFPCSFLEKEKGVDILKSKNFAEDVWNSKEISDFRAKLLNTTDCNNCRSCPEYKIIGD